MKIILATAIYPPAIGGPAEYVKKLAEGLRRKEIDVAVLSYGEGKSSKNLELVSNSPFRHFIYFIKLLALSKDADIIYAFDPLSAGLPAYLVAKLRGIKFVMRVGGDYLWERDMEAGRVWTTLRNYYESGVWKRHKVTAFLLKRIFAGVDQFIFTTDFLSEIYKKVFGIDGGKIKIIKNPFLSFEQPRLTPDKNNNIIFAGRFIRLKNLDNLILAFKKLTNSDLKLRLIGDGPRKAHLENLIKNSGLEGRVIIEPSMPREELFKVIAEARLCVLPSLSEVSPNFALECLSSAAPILLTSENGLGLNDFWPKQWLFHPTKDNLSEKLEEVIHADWNFTYLDARSWESVIEDNIKILCPSEEK